MASRTKLLVKSIERPLEGPLASLEQVLHDRWSEYLHSCSETIPTDEKHAVLAKLYAALARLSEAVRERTVAESILEIGANLMACEQMAILSLQEAAHTGSIVKSIGVPPQRLKSLTNRVHEIVEAVPEGEVYVAGESETTYPTFYSLGISACAPLCWKDFRKGAIVFFDFLPQRNGLNEADHALVKLLSIYAGPCLFDS